MKPRRLPRAAPTADFDLNPRAEPALEFPWRELGEMGPADYAEIGFLCGLEVHQQLLTRRKLFCRCPAGLRHERTDGEVLRHMRPTLSELGLYDGTALMEFKTRKEIVYLLDRRCVCTYEMDDTPPFPIDEQAVRIALEIALLQGMALASELEVMRKQYLDGSIPTGFQRTALVAAGGALPFRESELGRDRVLNLRQLTLEEDSCREQSNLGHAVRFLTDRLGTPLTETVTEPDLLTPRDVEAGARLLARTARASGKVRRGAGAARQDVNVSVAGGRRVELKGVPRHRGLPRLVHVEAFRQLELLRLRAELAARGVTAEMLVVPDDRAAWESGLAADVSSLLRGCTYAPARRALELGQRVAAVRLPRFGGLLERRTQPGVPFADEFAGRVRVIACLTSTPSLAHDRGGRGLAAGRWREVRQALRAERDDAVVLLCGPEEDVDTAAREVLARAREALVGVPSETRRVRPDGTTVFERVLPGPERMYPDTDTPPVPVPDAWVAEIEARLPERPWEREDRYVAAGLAPAAAARLAGAPWADLYDALAPRREATARRLAAAFEKRLVRHFRLVGRRDLPEPARLAPLVEALDAGRVRLEACEAALDALLCEPERPAAELLARFLPRADDAARLEARVGAVAGDPAGPVSRDGVALRWAMGEVMPEFLGRADPARVRERLAAALAARERSGA